MAIVTTPIGGVDISAVTAPVGIDGITSSTDGVGAQFALGTRVSGTDGQEYVYVQAGAAISTTTKQPFTLAIDENYQAVKITKALATAGHLIAVAPQQIIPDNYFFWAITRGSNFNMKVAVSCAADVNLWTTATAGVLDDTSGGTHVVVLGVKLVVAASASASAGSTVREVIMTNTLVPQLIA
jgi:hypothetical protein